jgi:hypothetical protein
VKKSAQKEDGQLYVLFNRLNRQVESRDECGRLIGYSILSGLVDFTSNSGSKELKFEIIKTIYSSIECAIASCDENGAYHTLCDLKLKVHNNINGQHSNSLLEEAIGSVQRRYGSFDDRLRRIGIALYDDISERGKIDTWRDILNSDYAAINNYIKIRGYSDGELS